ncbi:MAG: InlB B-repeat-containing protein [Prevotella sp.]|nr:InlB B-repeat-containing protein [Prevotella sp.]
MKKQNLLTRTLLLCALVVVSVSAWADEWSHTFSTTEKTFTTDETKTLSEVDWTLAVTWADDSNKDYNKDASGGMKIGSNSKVPSAMTLSTSGISGTIKTVSVTTYGRSKSTCTVGVKVNNMAYTTTDTWGGNTSKELKYTGSESGNIEITWTQGSSNQGAFYVTKITIEYEDNTVVKHTLSSAVSPVGVGNVTLGATEVGEGKSTTIVAEAANANYRFKNWTKTSGAIADENAASTTFTMGTTDATVTANFEEIPSHSLSYVVTPTGAGTVTLSSSSVKEDATATAEAAANAGYKFTGWSISGTGATLSSTTDNPTTVTMGTADATVTATFAEVVTHAISWSVNGSVVKTENVEEGTAITFAAPESGIPAGYVYKGWVADELDGASDTAPTYVTSATSTVDKTYYAVLAVETGTPATLIKQGKGATFSANDKIVVVAVIDNTSYGMYQETQSNSYVKNFGFKEDVNDIAADSKKWWTLNASNSKWKIGDNTNGYLYNSGSNNLSVPAGTTSATEWSIIDNEDGTFKIDKGGSGSRYVSCRTDLSGANANLFRMAGGTPAGVYSFNIYKYTEGSITSSGYCTTVPAIDVTITDAKYATFSDNTARDFSGSGITVYTAKADGTKVELEEVTDGIVPANTGVVLYAASATTTSIPAIATDKTSLADNEMVANVAAATVKYDGEGDKKNFILAKEDAGVGFYAATAVGATLAANRAYLSTTSVPASGVRFLGFDDDETTSIRSVENGQLTNDNVFNLAGQRVAHPVKGLYIVNGKKVVVK